MEKPTDREIQSSDSSQQCIYFGRQRGEVGLRFAFTWRLERSGERPSSEERKEKPRIPAEGRFQLKAGRAKQFSYPFNSVAPRTMNSDIMPSSQDIESWKVEDQEAIRFQDSSYLRYGAVLGYLPMIKDVQAHYNVEASIRKGHLIHRATNDVCKSTFVAIIDGNR